MTAPKWFFYTAVSLTAVLTLGIFVVGVEEPAVTIPVSIGFCAGLFVAFIRAYRGRSPLTKSSVGYAALAGGLLSPLLFRSNNSLSVIGETISLSLGMSVMVLLAVWVAMIYIDVDSNAPTSQHKSLEATTEKNWKQIILIVAVIAFCGLVWPTPYRYMTIGERPTRINRITGVAEILGGEGWVRLARE